MLRTLVISSDQDLWPSSGSILFLDESCINQKDCSTLETIDYEISKSTLFDQRTDDANFESRTKIYQSVFPSIATFLNSYHGVTYSDRYWQIVVDHWLIRAIDLIQMRYEKIEKALASKSISEVIVPTMRLIELPAITSSNFYWALYNGPLSALVNGELARRLALKFADVKVRDKSLKIDYFALLELERSSRGKLKLFLESFASSVNTVLSRDTDAFLLNTYMPRFKEFLLQISFGQAPAIYKTPSWTPNLADTKVRGLNLGSSQSLTDLENCVRSLILKLIPKSYLEDYKTIDHLAEQCNWPKNPKIICTANDYDMNDFFKIWTAKKVVRGVPFCIFQHGNNFFTKRHHVFPEIDYCDRFVAWGSKHTPKAMSGFVLKRAIKKSKKYEEFGKLLILSSYARSNISASENVGLNFFQIRDEKNFLKSLRTDLMDHVVFRIPDFNLRFTQTLETWSNFFSERKTKVLIETSAQDFGKSLMRSRIAVFSYYSTGFLECIAAERPAICFWQNKLNDFADYVIEDFKQMERVGLIHFTPESAAKHVNKHWDDVLSWWNNFEVECVRQDFAAKYARYSSQPVKDLKKLLT